MKKLNLKLKLFILIALAMTAYTSYGQSKPDSTSLLNSIKCFDDVKFLRTVNNAQKIMITENEKKAIRLLNLSDTLNTTNKALIKENTELKSKVKGLHRQVLVVAIIAAVELLVIFLK